MAREKITQFLLGSIFVINLIDATLTLRWISSGVAIEANPLMAALISYSPVLFWYVKVFVVSAAVIGLWINRKRSWVQFATSALAIIYGWVFLIHLGALGLWKI